MDKSIIDMLVAGRTPVDIALWSVAFLLILVGIGFMLRFEKRQYQSLGKPGSWLWLRLWSMPILVLTVLALVVPARIISGPEALAYFYIALFTLAPIIWFGLHRIIGSMLTPSLTKRESTNIALLGLAILIAPPLVIGMLQGPIFMTSRLLNERMFAGADYVPLPLEIQPAQRFRLGDAGEIYTQTLRVPTGIDIERVDAMLGGGWHDTKTMMHIYLCRQGEDLHLAWSGKPPPPLKMFWRDGDSGRRQSEFRVDLAAAKALSANDFIVGWRDDGIDLPVPIHRDNVQLGWVNGDSLYYRSLNPLQQGESFENDCVMKGYRRIAWQKEGPIAGLMLRFYSPEPGESWQYEVKRTPEKR